MSVEEIHAACEAFIRRAFDALARERVIPPSIFHRYLSVGTDYYGGSINNLSEYRNLEYALNQTFPQRFAEPLKRRDAEFASSFIFDFLEECIARAASTTST